MEKLIGFGLGKRSCLGERLARMNTFMIFAAFLQNFTLERVPGGEELSRVPISGFTVAPQKFSGVVKIRRK